MFHSSHWKKEEATDFLLIGDINAVFKVKGPKKIKARVREISNVFIGNLLYASLDLDSIDSLIPLPFLKS
jgi:hypothetical protein